jgi:hypothetical protein
MFFIAIENQAWATPEITGTLKKQAEAGKLALIDPSRMKYYGIDGAWKPIENWIHPFKGGEKAP